MGWRNGLVVRHLIITLKLTGAPTIGATVMRCLDVLIDVINIYTQKSSKQVKFHIIQLLLVTASIVLVNLFKLYSPKCLILSRFTRVTN